MKNELRSIIKNSSTTQLVNKFTERNKPLFPLFTQKTTLKLQGYIPLRHFLILPFVTMVISLHVEAGFSVCCSYSRRSMVVLLPQGLMIFITLRSVGFLL